MRIRAAAALTALVVAGSLVIGVGAASAKSSKAPPCAGSTKSAAIKAVKKAYDLFLNGTIKPPRTLAARKLSIEGISDPALSALFDKTQAANAATAATTTIKLSAVKCTGKSAASVTADLVVAGQTLKGIFPNPGGAVIEGGVWKVSKRTFCDLETLSDPNLAKSGPCAV
jgi:hypothetical protein